jgi:AraC family transcriptional regulator
LQATVPEREVPLHTHEMPHLILVTAGMYVTEARNQSGVCSAGTLIFNPAGTTHRDCFRSLTGEFLSISPGPEMARLLERASPVPLIVAGQGTRGANEALIVDRIVQEMHQTPSSAVGVLEALGLELVALLSAIGGDPSHHIPSWLQSAREMIEDCFEQELSLAELATAVGVHPVYLARAYRRHFQCSPGEHLRRCRLLRVRGLLAQTDLPLVEVALESGFSDQSQMTRWFSESFGVSPGRYRRLHRA